MDSVSTGSTNGLSLVIPHTTSGADRLMLVGVSINNDNLETVSSITYNGTSLSYVGSETQNDDARVELWKLVAPPTGTYNVVITFSANLQRYAVAGVITFTGVNQTTPLGSFAGNNATSNSASVSVPSATGDLVLGVFGCETCTSVSFTAPATQRWNVSAGSGMEIGAGATKVGSSPNTTVAATLGSSDHWAMGGVAVKPVGGGSGKAAAWEFASFAGKLQSPGRLASGSAANPAPQVNARPREVKGLRMQLTLVRETGVVWRSYYFAGASRIAMREDSDTGSEVYYILTDHLGSTSLTVYEDEQGQMQVKARQWYKPWGEVRQSVGQLPTDRTFQGQREPGWGLTHFGARWFDSHLGRFAQADSIIPGAGLSIAWDRYAGMNNNPVRWKDPSGHMPIDGPCGLRGEDCSRVGTSDKWHKDSSYIPFVPKSLLQSNTSDSTVQDSFDTTLGGNNEAGRQNDNEKKLTTAQKIGKGLTYTLVMIIIVYPAEVTLISLSIAAAEVSPLALLELVLIPADIVVADFGISYGLSTWESIESGQDVEFTWTILPALAAVLPEPVQEELHNLLPRIFP